jgi:hypothetical protein
MKKGEEDKGEARPTVGGSSTQCVGQVLGRGGAWGWCSCSTSAGSSTRGRESQAWGGKVRGTGCGRPEGPELTQIMEPERLGEYLTCLPSSSLQGHLCGDGVWDSGPRTRKGHVELLQGGLTPLGPKMRLCSPSTLGHCGDSKGLILGHCGTR